MKYVKLNNNTIADVIPEYSPSFPGVPASDRYPASYLSECLKVEDDVNTPVGWVYNGSTFVEGTPVPIPEFVKPITLEDKFNQLDRSMVVFKQGILAMMEG